jgi:hypothetical protein
MGGAMPRRDRRRGGAAAADQVTPRDAAPAGESPEAAAAELVARESYGRLVAYLAARWRDVPAAEVRAFLAEQMPSR